MRHPRPQRIEVFHPGWWEQVLFLACGCCVSPQPALSGGPFPSPGQCPHGQSVSSLPCRPLPHWSPWAQSSVSSVPGATRLLLHCLSLSHGTETLKALNQAIGPIPTLQGPWPSLPDGQCLANNCLAHCVHFLAVSGKTIHPALAASWRPETEVLRGKLIDFSELLFSHLY